MQLTDLAGAPFTYPGVGGTLTGEFPPGFPTVSMGRDLGEGPELLARAAEALMTWRLHRAFGLRPRATSPRVAEGVEVLGRLGPWPVGLAVPCRVVWTVEEPGRVGFAYGTLPGHPEAGEESFLVEDVDGRARFTVSAFSRGARWYSTVAPAATGLVQRVAIRRYLSCLHRLANEPG